MERLNSDKAKSARNQREKPDWHGENDVRDQRTEPRCVLDKTRRLKEHIASLDVTHNLAQRWKQSDGISEAWRAQWRENRHQRQTNAHEHPTSRLAHTPPTGPGTPAQTVNPLFGQGPV